jgi:dihydrofolate reductase
MSKIILYVASSLDGFISGPNDDVSWQDTYSQVDYGYNDFVSTVGAIILGRRTFDLITSKSSWSYPIPTFVLTSRVLKNSNKDLSITAVSSPQEAANLAQKSTNQNIWLVGGQDTIKQFLDANLVDELVITITPDLLGSGTKLFDSTTQKLQLIQSITLNQGLVQLTYRPV